MINDDDRQHLQGFSLRLNIRGNFLQSGRKYFPLPLRLRWWRDESLFRASGYFEYHLRLFIGQSHLNSIHPDDLSAIVCTHQWCKKIASFRSMISRKYRIPFDESVSKERFWSREEWSVSSSEQRSTTDLLSKFVSSANEFLDGKTWILSLSNQSFTQVFVLSSRNHFHLLCRWNLVAMIQYKNNSPPHRHPHPSVNLSSSFLQY